MFAEHAIVVIVGTKKMQSLLLIDWIEWWFEFIEIYLLIELNANSNKTNKLILFRRISNGTKFF